MGIQKLKLGPKSKLLTRAGVAAPGGAFSKAAGQLLEAARPERAGREGDQQLPAAGMASVFAEVHERLDERESTGVRRYGRSLETFNGRNAFRDAEEEALDLVVYLTQVRMEHAAMLEALFALARHVTGESVSPDTLKAALDVAQKLEAVR